MEQQAFHHALKIRHDVCTGCSHCMKVCPTEALRVHGGKALLYPVWCIDCGECHRACPTRAIVVEDDDFKDIFRYRHRILLIPSVFIGQFGATVSRREIIDILLYLGFTDVREAEHGVDFLIDEINRYLQTHEKPVISSFCPAVTRLIQIRFPALVDHVLRLKQPLEVTTEYFRQWYARQDIDPGEVGIFYLTPCAAKIASIKAPVGDYASPIDGVINMNYMYNRVLQEYRQHAKEHSATAHETQVSARGMTWSLTGGEVRHIDGKGLAIDGIENVVEFLERLENDEISGVDYLELRACDESCSGGILTPYNRFLAAECIRLNAQAQASANDAIGEYQQYLSGAIDVGEIRPRSMVKYDLDITKALQKMEKARKLKRALPGVDCGACGAPSCEALAEDIVRGQASVEHCIFIQTRSEKQGLLPQEQAIKIMEKIWGKEKIDECAMRDEGIKNR
ncbi:MAG: 4Fe-4S binding protein [Prevotellaceae bacterium]|jgi:iron only hydrogenase large subunit-like protein|nr:4Fe-4S binding protein [Prevotellaceae bacterium]